MISHSLFSALFTYKLILTQIVKYKINFIIYIGGGKGMEIHFLHLSIPCASLDLALLLKSNSIKDQHYKRPTYKRPTLQKTYPLSKSIHRTSAAYNDAGV